MYGLTREYFKKVVGSKGFVIYTLVLNSFQLKIKQPSKMVKRKIQTYEY